jgi:hypothetical protein
MQPAVAGRLGSWKGQSRASKSASLAGRAITMEVDNITALFCKSIDGKASLCNSENIKTLADKTWFDVI